MFGRRESSPIRSRRKDFGAIPRQLRRCQINRDLGSRTSVASCCLCLGDGAIPASRLLEPPPRRQVQPHSLAFSEYPAPVTTPSRQVASGSGRDAFPTRSDDDLAVAAFDLKLLAFQPALLRGRWGDPNAATLRYGVVRQALGRLFLEQHQTGLQDGTEGSSSVTNALSPGVKPEAWTTEDGMFKRSAARCLPFGVLSTAAMGGSWFGLVMVIDGGLVWVGQQFPATIFAPIHSQVKVLARRYVLARR